MLFSRPASADPSLFRDPTHQCWLEEARTRLLNFYFPNVWQGPLGFAYLDQTGQPLPDKGAQLWIGARMTHCFSIAHLLGYPQAERLAQNGVDFYLRGPGRDHQYGGWFDTVGGTCPNPAKELYGQAHIVLAASSARQAQIEGAQELLAEALDLIDRYYWLEDEGRCLEAYDQTFTRPDSYRGQNANMHLAEAYLAAYEATGEVELLNRAVRIAHNTVGQAATANGQGAGRGQDQGQRTTEAEAAQRDKAQGEPAQREADRIASWRIPEHFRPDWTPDYQYNVDDPRHPFRPYGSQPGHWLEWAKLLTQIYALGRQETWLLPAAETLVQGAMQDGWQPGGGFVYTVDWNGQPVVAERFWWPVAEGIGAVRNLAELTGRTRYYQYYQTYWQYCVQHLLDPATGTWYPELDSDNQPVVHTWVGRPDLYHCLQATAYAQMPVNQGIAAWAAGQPA